MRTSMPGRTFFEQAMRTVRRILMKPIICLALNPTIDSSCQADEVKPIKKIRTSEERYDPGGGGVNVARVVRALGGEAVVIYLAGGITGGVLTEMLERLGIEHRPIPIAGNTWVSHVVFERSSSQEYRFTPQGPELQASEWQACLEQLEQMDAEYLVASGSLPRGVPADFYAKMARIGARKGARVVVDTSGDALREAVAEGVYLIKPNLRELELLAGRELRDEADQEAAARALIEEGRIEVVTVSLGADGALLVSSDDVFRLKAPDVKPKSAVGAGDSFVGAMVLGIAQGRPLRDAFTLAVATGTATVLTMGTELCRREDVERIYCELKAGASED
jgi:6-phosphofructokinase 2